MNEPDRPAAAKSAPAPAPASPSTRPAPGPERPGVAVRGPVVLLITAAIAVVVPLVTVLIFRVVDTPSGDGAADTGAGADRPPLVWAERDTWPDARFVTYKSLERGMMSSARTNQRYRDLGFAVSADEQRATLELAALARRSRDAFAAADTGAALDRAVAGHPGLFYARWLRAKWRRINGDAAGAEADLTAAFAAAPAALITEPRRDGGHRLAFAADQVVADRLDRGLMLVFPFLEPDADGKIYLPVYKTILRRVDPARPAGVTNVEEQPRWFTWAGQVGRLPALGARGDPTVPQRYGDGLPDTGGF